MSDSSERPTRRDVLRRGATGIAVAAVGSASGIGLSSASGDDVPVVDNGGDPDETITVDVEVVDQSGAPVENVTVKLEDRGGTPDDRYGQTGSSGRLRFIESVGPPPCNSQRLVLPEYATATRLGCNEGGSKLSHTFRIDREESGNDGEERTVADYAGDDGVVDTPELARAITDWATDEIDADLLVELIVAWASGDPVS